MIGHNRWRHSWYKWQLCRCIKITTISCQWLLSDSSTSWNNVHDTLDPYNQRSLYHQWLNCQQFSRCLGIEITMVKHHPSCFVTSSRHLPHLLFFWLQWQWSITIVGQQHRFIRCPMIEPTELILIVICLCWLEIFINKKMADRVEGKKRKRRKRQWTYDTLPHIFLQCSLGAFPSLVSMNSAWQQGADGGNEGNSG